MTPFGARIRAMRVERGHTLAQMAAAIGVSAPYLSQLEHGRRGRPSWPLVQRIIAYFNVIWDEAEELQRLAAQSDPRVTVDTAGLSPKATRFANRIARDIHRLDDAEELQRLAEAYPPRITIDTAGMPPAATALANELAQTIGQLDGDAIALLRIRLAELSRPRKR